MERTNLNRDVDRLARQDDQQGLLTLLVGVVIGVFATLMGVIMFWALS